MKKRNYDCPRIPRIPWNRPGLKNVTFHLFFLIRRGKVKLKILNKDELPEDVGLFSKKR